MHDGPLKTALKGVRDNGESVVTRATGLPPRRLRSQISPVWFDFKQSGADQLEFFVELCGLKATDRVLDIGCGVGRVAIPLSRYLSSEGGYDGFDVVPQMIDWCQAQIGTKHPNFRFHVAEVYSTINSIEGGADPAAYRFPFEDETFDFAYAGSLFTHLTPAASENYLRETMRTLKSGGRLVATFNMYNEDTERHVPGRRLEQYWPHAQGTHRLKEAQAPESNVAYAESYVRDAYARAGLTVLEPLRPDASYSPARAPKRSDDAANLWYSTSIIAVRP
jgi:SAM-dependent methyltransferase